MTLDRRPARVVRGVAACTLLGLVVATAAGCESHKVPIESGASLSATDRAACAALLDALPDTLGGELRRPVDPDDALGAAWGDPAYVVRCGVALPEEYDAISSCDKAGGVGWFAPPEQASEQGMDATLTAVGFEPLVEVTVPAAYRPNGVASALTELAPAIRQTLTRSDRC